ncbi:MAG: PorT family protein [Bacteroidales bacterium]|nr:PorT family protein [Bacteroidales bacterium]
MKRTWILLLVLATMSVETQAQSSRNSRKQFENQWISMGVKGGVTVSQMLYWHNEALARLPQDTVLSPVFGVFADIPLGSALSVAPEVMFVKHGIGMSYSHYSGVHVDYTMRLKHLDLRVPLELRWPVAPWLQPYLAVGLEGGICLGDSIRMLRTPPSAYSDIALNSTIAVGEANMSLLHAGAFVGLGLRSKVEVGGRDVLLKLSASYHQGLTDTYSAKERQGSSNAVNVNAYQITGSRLPQGLELTLGIGLSLKSHDMDACATFARDRIRHRSRGHWFGF